MKADRASRLIVEYMVTPASANDGAHLPDLVDKNDRMVHADCAYNRDLVDNHMRTLGIRACL